MRLLSMLLALATEFLATSAQMQASPKLQSTGFPSEISLGDDTAAICLVSKGSSGPFKMTWYKDGHEVRNSDRVTVVVGASKAVLNIDAVRVEDIGNYTCAATNRFGADSLTVPLLVTAPPKLGELWFPPDVTLGDEVVVTCVVKKGSAGPYQITWEKDGREVAGKGTDLRVFVSTLSMGSVALRIASLRAEDVGNYSCTARNRFGSDSVTAPLVVHAPPKLQSSGFPSEVSLGDDTVATCLVKKGSSGPFKMAWHKDGDEVRDTDRITVVTKASSVVLSIEGVQVADIGNYTCSAANEVGVDALTMSLVITASNHFSCCSTTTVADFIFELRRDAESSSVNSRFSKNTMSSAGLKTVTDCLVCLLVLLYFPNALAINSVAPTVGKFGFPLDVSLGDEVMENCVVKKGSPGPYRIALLKDGEEIRGDDRVTVSSHSKSSATLRIASLRPEDVGNYTCTASNAYGSDSVTAALLVHGPPKLHSSGFSSELSLGEDAAATCAVKKGASGPFLLSWHKGSREIESTDRITVSTKATSAMLSIDSIQVGDVGNYTCVAKNAFGSDTLVLPLLVSEPPQVGEFSFPAKLAIGDEVIALCAVKKGSVGPYRITWRKDGSELKPSERLSMSALFKSSAALSIASLRPEDVGNYTCTATNAVGSGTASAMLVVHGPPRVFEFSFPPEVALGDEIIVGCAVKKGTSGPYRIAWQKDGTDIDSDGRLSVFGQSKTSAALRITGVQPEDVGNYTCVAKNSFGSDSFTAQLVIHVPPKLQSAGFPSEISLGDDTAAMCLVTKGSSGPFDIAWHKDGQTVRNTDRIAVSVKASSAVLNIQEIRVEDVGNYSCTATNRYGTDSLTLSLLVTAAPKVGELSFPSDVALGDEVIVTCVVKKGSAGPYRITWEKDGREAKDAGGARVSVSTPSESSATLRIASLRAEDVGNYTCTARNSFGSDSITAPLVVHAPPKLQSAGFPSEVSLGDDTVATCLVKKGSSGPFKMAWHKDGNELRNTNRLSVVSHVNSILLRVEGIQVDDIGNFTCSAANDFGTDVLTLPLLVTAPKVGGFAFPPDVALGDEIVESCVVKKGSVGPYRIALLKDGKLIEAGDRVSVSSASKSSVTLRIGSLKPEDVGNYTCAASNQYGSDSVTATLVVNGGAGGPYATVHFSPPDRAPHHEDPGTPYLLALSSAPEPDNAPKIQAFSFSPDLSLGDAAAVTCAVKRGSRGPHNLSWLKDSRGLAEDHRVSAARQSDMLYTLTIRDVGPDDVGNYTCVARNARGQDTFTAPLAVSESQKAHVSGPPNVQEFRFPGLLSTGDTAVVSCVVRKGSLSPYTLLWLKNGHVLDAVSRSNALVSHQGDSISTLTLKDIAVEDNGNYTCVASNAAGSGVASALLAVTGRLDCRAGSNSQAEGLNVAGDAI
nr:hemicentin-2-like [Dermacentor andersoni]